MKALCRQVRSAHQIRRLSFLLLVVCTALLLLALHACGQESVVQTQSELKAKSQVQNQITSQLESRSPNLVYVGLLGRGIMYGEGSNSSVRPRGNST